MDPEGSLPHSQVPTTCPYPEPARSSPIPHIQQSVFVYTNCGHVEGCTTNHQKINSILEFWILINCSIHFVSTCTLFCFIQDIYCYRWSWFEARSKICLAERHVKIREKEFRLCRIHWYIGSVWTLRLLVLISLLCLSRESRGLVFS